MQTNKNTDNTNKLIKSLLGYIKILTEEVDYYRSIKNYLENTSIEEDPYYADTLELLKTTEDTIKRLGRAIYACSNSL